MPISFENPEVALIRSMTPKGVTVLAILASMRGSPCSIYRLMALSGYTRNTAKLGLLILHSLGLAEAKPEGWLVTEAGASLMQISTNGLEVDSTAVQ